MTEGGAAVVTGGLAAPTAMAAVEINALNPAPEQLKAFTELPDDGPLFMLNLLKFKPDGGEAQYAKYSAAVQPILVKLGAKIVFMGRAEFCLIGNADWDSVVIVQYPSRSAFLGMISSPEYQAIHHHREAGLEGQVLYALRQSASLG
jgi:uncharacterized protein (DUF1330 family)